MNRGEYPIATATEYVQSLSGSPDAQWDSMKLTTKPRFIGAGAAIASSESLRAIMTSWRSQQKELTLGDTGKRTHIPGACSECAAGISPWEKPHRLAIKSRSDGETLSFPRALPWEGKHTPEIEEIRLMDAIEREMVSR